MGRTYLRLEKRRILLTYAEPIKTVFDCLVCSRQGSVKGSDKQISSVAGFLLGENLLAQINSLPFTLR